MSTYTSFVAVGDSFTEGMSDGLPDGGYRGWADLVATRLSTHTTGFRYANLAIRGKLVGQIVDGQVDAAAAMRPDLVSFAGGMNDVLRPGCDIGAVCARVEHAAETLAGSAKRLVLFRVMDPTGRMRGSGRLMPRITRLIRLVDDLAARHDAVLVDLFSAKVFDHPLLWADDRIHLSAEGHRRVAEATMDALGLPADRDWASSPPPQAPSPWLDQRRADLRWARVHLGPWVGRRLTGRSSGDGRCAKRPTLLPYPATD